MAEKTLVCTCDNCGNEAEMTIKCEEIVTEAPAPPEKELVRRIKRRLACSHCGTELEKLFDMP